MCKKKGCSNFPSVRVFMHLSACSCSVIILSAAIMSSLDVQLFFTKTLGLCCVLSAASQSTTFTCTLLISSLNTTSVSTNTLVVFVPPAVVKQKRLPEHSVRPAVTFFNAKRNLSQFNGRVRLLDITAFGCGGTEHSWILYILV